jgi:site-specific recombinase XerC
VKRYDNLAGIEQNREVGIHPLLFRREFTVNFLKQTHNLVALKELRGHTSILRTMITVTKVSKKGVGRVA